MPSLPTNLVRVGSVYKYRARIPQDLLTHYHPRKEIMISLRTTRLDEARRLLPQVQQKQFEEWDRIRGIPTQPASPIEAISPQTPSQDIPWDNPIGAWRLDPATGRQRLLIRDYPINDTLIDFVTSLMHHDTLAGDEERRQASNYTLPEIQSQRNELAAANKFLRDTISVGDMTPISKLALQILNLRGVRPVGSPEDFHRLYLAYARTALQANEDLLRQLAGKVVQIPEVKYPESEPNEKNGLYALFEYWRDLVPDRLKRTIIDVERRIRALDTLLKGKSADQITRKDIIAYRDHLIQQGKAPKTVAKDLSFIKAVLQQAFEAERIPSNPAAAIKVPQAKTATARQRHLEPADLKILFGSPIYQADERPVAGGGDAAAWIPLIALYSGARLEEICQLQVGDIKTEGGLHYFSIQPVSDEESGTQTTLKNDESRRSVPIHHALLDAGLLNYAAAVEGAGHSWLFPFLKPDIYNKRGGNFTKWWSRWRKSLGLDGTHRCFHAFRHVFKTACRAAGMPEEVHDAITGHTGSGIGRSYGRVPLKTVHEAIQHVHYEGLGLNWEWKKLAVQRVRRTRRVAVRLK